MLAIITIDLWGFPGWCQKPPSQQEGLQSTFLVGRETCINCSVSEVTAVASNLPLPPSCTWPCSAISQCHTAVMGPKELSKAPHDFSGSNFYMGGSPWDQRKLDAWPPEAQESKMPSFTVPNGKSHNANLGFWASRDSGASDFLEKMLPTCVSLLLSLWELC